VHCKQQEALDCCSLAEQNHSFYQSQVENSGQKKDHKLIENTLEVELKESADCFEVSDFDTVDCACASNLEQCGSL
jgi:hypothetical protein